MKHFVFEGGEVRKYLFMFDDQFQLFIQNSKNSRWTGGFSTLARTTLRKATIIVGVFALLVAFQGSKRSKEPHRKSVTGSLNDPLMQRPGPPN
jgi:hypothetical protein